MWMRMDNKKRDAQVQGRDTADLEDMSEKQIEDLDWKHPNFRWKL